MRNGLARIREHLPLHMHVNTRFVIAASIQVGGTDVSPVIHLRLAREQSREAETEILQRVAAAVRLA